MNNDGLHFYLITKVRGFSYVWEQRPSLKLWFLKLRYLNRVLFAEALVLHKLLKNLLNIN